MKHILFYFFFLVSQITLASTKVTKVTVAYFGRVSDQEFNEKLKPLFKEISKCADCELINSTPYDKESKYDDGKVLEKLNEVAESAQIIFFDWNDEIGQQVGLVEKLQKLKSQQKLIVASAGYPVGDKNTCPLSGTVFGKIDDAIIVGELIQKDILWPKCYFGPQMLTAVRPPREHMGKGVGPLIFTARFAAQYGKRSPDEWVQFFRTKKSKNRKIWPDLEDFFPRG